MIVNFRTEREHLVALADVAVDNIRQQCETVDAKAANDPRFLEVAVVLADLFEHVGAVERQVLAELHRLQSEFLDVVPLDLHATPLGRGQRAGGHAAHPTHGRGAPGAGF